MEDELVLELKPKYSIAEDFSSIKTWIYCYNMMLILLLAWIPILAGSILMRNDSYVVEMLGDPHIACFLMFILSLILGPLFFGYLNKLNYKNMIYRVYNDKIVIINKNKEKAYDIFNIKNISVSQNNTQKKNNVGTLYFKLKNPCSYCEFVSIESPHDTCAKISTLINRADSSELFVVKPEFSYTGIFADMLSVGRGLFVSVAVFGFLYFCLNLSLYLTTLFLKFIYLIIVAVVFIEQCILRHKAFCRQAEYGVCTDKILIKDKSSSNRLYINFKEIISMKLYQTASQKKSNTGDIVIIRKLGGVLNEFIDAVKPLNKRANIVLMNVKNPEEVYKKLKQLIGEIK